MPFRKRPKEDPEAATRELSRAREAMSYWAQQEQDALEELASLQGVFGWLKVLTGEREEAIQQAERRILHARGKIKAERMAFVAARQAVEQQNQRAQVQKQQDDQRLLDLEELALRLRESNHPTSAQLEVLEDGLDRTEKQLQRYQDVIAAAGGLNAAIGQIERFALQMQTRVWGMTRTPEAIRAYRKLPKAIQRFMDACIDAGIEPPSLKVPSDMVGQAAMDPMYWVSGDNDWAFHRLRQDLLDERDTISMIQMEAAKERKDATAERDGLYEQRRLLLESIAGTE